MGYFGLAEEVNRELVIFILIEDLPASISPTETRVIDVAGCITPDSG